MDSVESPFFSELLGARVPYSGAAITGLTPLFAGALSAVGGWPLVTAYVTLACLAPALRVLVATGTLRKDTAEMDPVVLRVIAGSRVQ